MRFVYLSGFFGIVTPARYGRPKAFPWGKEAVTDEGKSRTQCGTGERFYGRQIADPDIKAEKRPGGSRGAWG